MVDPRSAALASALGAWRSALGPSYVSIDSADLARAGVATFATSTAVVAILRPGDRSEVQAAVRIASETGISLYPISTGRNWGYGSSVPTRDAALLDLGRLNRIVDFDEDLAYVTIEPGVTQQQLFDFLRARGSRLWMDATGASPDCSIVGNTLERGFGHTPMGDHAGSVCGLEVVLASGECIETGFARFPNARIGALNRWGLGPSLDGLFSQSNLGIVTRATLWLMPAPEYFQAFFFQCEEANALAGVVDALRPLRLQGTLRSVVHIGNDYKVLSATGQYPWRETGGVVPLRRREIDAIRAATGVGRWSGSGGLYGTRRQVAEARRLVRRALAGKVSRVQFVDDRVLRWLPRLTMPYRWVTGHDLRRTLALLVPVYNLLKGEPTSRTLRSCYWRKSSAIPSQPDPDRDRCGLLWLSPLAPNTGRDAAIVADTASDFMLAHGFEPIISVSLLNERSLVSVIAITYDRDVAGEDCRALACHDELSQRLLSMGYPPYRLGLTSMALARDDGAYGRLLGELKRAIDPGAILAPGRYGIGADIGLQTAPATIVGDRRGAQGQ